MTETPPQDPLKPKLWTPRGVDETLAIYRDWAGSYDADVEARGYQTPARIAQALADVVPRDARILDYGCGTGISGTALRTQGFEDIDGTDISDAMVDVARSKGVYGRLWTCSPGEVPAAPGDYDAITAVGVVSLGAAPPEALDTLLAAAAPGCVIALSFNDATLADGSYDALLDRRLTEGAATLASRDHGTHLSDMKMGSDVIVLKRL